MTDYPRRPITDNMTRDDLLAEVDRLNRVIESALTRYDREDEHNNHVGFVRGACAWAMAADLREAFQPWKEGRQNGY